MGKPLPSYEPFPCPCRKCNDRIMGCHSVCDKYKEWSDKMKVENERVRAIKIKHYNDRIIDWGHREK